MRASTRFCREGAKGVAYILTLILLAVFTTLAVAFAATTHTNLCKSDSSRQAVRARLAAESGLAFVMRALRGVQSQGHWTGQPDVTDMVVLVHSHLAGKLDGTGNLGGASVLLDDSGTGDPFVAVPPVALPGGKTFTCTVRKATITDPDTGAPVEALELAATGFAGIARRKVAVYYRIDEDTSVLSYAVASRPRMIVRGDVNIQGDLCSTWARTNVAPPFDIRLGTEGQLAAGIKTVMSQDDFEADACQDYVDEPLRAKLSYDEPPITQYATEDFDTGPIIDWMADNGTKNDLPSIPSDQRQWEGFPEGNPKTWFKRPFYHDTTYSWTYVPANSNAHFVNCTFTGITYIEDVNNVVFEDCTFEGPLVTDVPPDFQWKTNSLYFKGATEFKPSEIRQHLDGCTILAPNFNVNIGDFHKSGASSDSKITGILVGGIVDIRDHAYIEGTILSMANLDKISAGIWYYGTNLGYWEGDYEEAGGGVPMSIDITIRPNPDSVLPVGIRKRYTVAVIPETYVEMTP